MDNVAYKPSILFRSTRNTDLSQMAHGLFDALGGGEYFDIEGAGMDPPTKEGVSSGAYEIMDEQGINLRLFTNHICKGCFDDVSFDFAIALSDDQFAECIHVDPSRTVRATWNLPELNSVDSGDPTVLASISERLYARLEMLLALAKQPDWFGKPKGTQEFQLRQIHERALAQESVEPPHVSAEAEREVIDLTQERESSTPPRGGQSERPGVAELHDPSSGELSLERTADYLGIAPSVLSDALRNRQARLKMAPTTSARELTETGLHEIERGLEILSQTLVGGHDEALRWLNTPHPEFGMRSSMDLIREGHADAVVTLLEDFLQGATS